MPLSPLYATLTPTPFQIPIADGSALLDAWVTPALTNPMTTDQDLIVGGFGGAPGRLGVGGPGEVLTVGSGGLVDWLPSTGGMTNPMTTRWDLIVGGLAGAPARLGVGTVGQVLTVGSGGIVDWENPAASGGTVTTVSVVSANGFAGTVATATTTPAITLTTTVTGILSGNGTAISAASTTGSGAVVLATAPTLPSTVTVGAASGTTGAVLFKGTTSGTFTMSVNDAAGTWTAKWPATAGSSTNVLTTDGSGNLSWSAAGTGSGTVNSGTATQFAYYASSSTAVSSTPTFTVSSAGRLVMTPTAISSGATSALVFNAPADTSLTVNTESILVSFVGGTRTWVDGNIAIQRDYVFGASTYSRVTIFNNVTVGATVAITDAPSPGPGCTVATALALWLQAGALGFGSSGSIAKVSSSSGGFLLNTAGAGNVTFTAPSSNNAIFVVNAGSGTTAPLIYLQRATTQKATFGVSAAANSGVTGAATDDFFLRSDAASLIFSSDGGSSLAGKFVVTTGQFTLPKNITSTSTTTGTLVVTGGVGISGAVFTGGAITTGAPSGGTAAAWKFGVVASVSPTAQNRTIELDVGGTRYFLTAKTTND